MRHPVWVLGVFTALCGVASADWGHIELVRNSSWGGRLELSLRCRPDTTRESGSSCALVQKRNGVTIRERIVDRKDMAATVGRFQGAAGVKWALAGAPKRLPSRSTAELRWEVTWEDQTSEGQLVSSASVSPELEAVLALEGELRFLFLDSY